MNSSDSRSQTPMVASCLSSSSSSSLSFTRLNGSTTVSPSNGLSWIETADSIQSYQPPSVDDVKQLHERVATMLRQLASDSPTTVVNGNEVQSFQKQLADKLSVLSEQSIKILTFAPLYDCGSVASNGFFSFGKLSIRFLQLIEHNLQTISSRGRLDSMEQVFAQAIDSFLQMTKYMVQQHESILAEQKQIEEITDATEVNNNSDRIDRRLCIFRPIRLQQDSNGNQPMKLPLFTSGLEHFQEMIRTAITYQAPRVSLMTHFGVFWLDRSMNNFFNLYSFLIPFFKLNLMQSIKCVWNRQFRLSKYIELVR
jgi:hypothetical protein